MRKLSLVLTVTAIAMVLLALVGCSDPRVKTLDTQSHVSFGKQVDESPAPVEAKPLDPDEYVSDVYDYDTAYYACMQYNWEPAIVARCQWSAAIFFNVTVRGWHYSEQPGAPAHDA